VRVGNFISVSGTTAVRADGTIEGKGDTYAQAAAALVTIGKALEELGAHMSDVVRTRIFVVDMDDSEAVGRAHGEVFADIKPTATMIEVNRLIHPDMRVEIEADAIVTED
jgi:enamine deaminase RidA (YjgF/YER057c/UK114 family)